jgi:hypothetical protein
MIPLSQQYASKVITALMGATEYLEQYARRGGTIVGKDTDTILNCSARLKVLVQECYNNANGITRKEYGKIWPST